MPNEPDNVYFYGEAYPAIVLVSTPPYIAREFSEKMICGFPVLLSEKMPKDEIRMLDGLAEQYTLKIS